MEPNQSQVAVRLHVENTSNGPSNHDTRRPLAACGSKLNRTLSRAREMLTEIEHLKSGNAMERLNVLMIEHLIEDLEIIHRGLNLQRLPRVAPLSSER